MKKGLYIECNSGISGDMSVAALIDLGADPKKLTDTLQTLPLKGYRTEIRSVTKSGISALDFSVILDEENHDHDMEYLHSHDTDIHCHERHHDHQEQIHSHNCEAESPNHEHHPKTHSHEHHHSHEHRSLTDVLDILRSGSLTPGALSLAEKIFRILAEGEAAAHGIPAEQVHFHEVGAVDSIVDIASFSICLDMLGYEDIFITGLCDGTGTIRCQHGIIPVPVPAVVNILRQHPLPLTLLPVHGELVTPTGDAIAASICTSCELPSSFHILRTGIGAGKRTYKETSGILRIMEISY